LLKLITFLMKKQQKEKEEKLKKGVTWKTPSLVRKQLEIGMIIS